MFCFTFLSAKSNRIFGSGVFGSFSRFKWLTPLIIHCTFLILVLTTSSVAICHVMKAEFSVTLNKLVVAKLFEKCVPKVCREK